MTKQTKYLKKILESECNDDATKTQFKTEQLERVLEQIQYLKAENHELHNLNDNTLTFMKSLRSELQALKNKMLIKNTDDNKEMCENTVQLLEQTVFNQKKVLDQQVIGIQQLLEQKETLQMQIKCLEDGNEEKLRKIQNLTEETAEQDSDTVEHWKVRYFKLQEVCKHLQQILGDQLKREICAVKKIEQTLCVADSALAERDERDKECKRLSLLTDEAVKKIEKNILSEKRKYKLKERNLKDENEKLSDTCENLKKFIEIITTRCDRYEDRYEVAISETARLTNELCAALGDIEDLKAKVKERDKIISEGKRTNSMEEHEEAIKNCNESPKSLYDSYEAIIAEHKKSLIEEAKLYKQAAELQHKFCQ